MEEKLISKKELLKSTGISYGQFYRWKRKDLIPEKWLIHKSTRTGQESFLPEDKILPRIEKIKELKKDNTLKEIANLLSPELVEKTYERQSLSGLGWVDDQLMRAYENIVGTKNIYSFRDLLGLLILVKLKQSGASAGNTYLALKTLDLTEKKIYDLHEKLIIVNKKDDFVETEKYSEENTGFCLIAPGGVEFDPSMEVGLELDLPELVRELKLRLRESERLDREG